jgi:glutathione synthase/RimK-type ligase-like ATP-grasp enzyme
VHPENGIALVGRDIPVWSDILDVGRRAALSVPLGYVGVDIVVDASRGPLVLELNARPGLEIQNVNAQALGPLVRGRSR